MFQDMNFRRESKLGFRTSDRLLNPELEYQRALDTAHNRNSKRLGGLEGMGINRVMWTGTVFYKNNLRPTGSPVSQGLKFNRGLLQGSQG